MPHKPVQVQKKDRGAFLQELQAFIQAKGFIWGPFPEIYGGLAGFYSYGPLGKLLKDKVETTVKRTFQSHGFWEVECPIVIPDTVWEASGHLTTFTDPVIHTKDKKESYRADKLLEDKDIVITDHSDAALLELIRKHDITAPNGKPLEFKISHQSLMMKTTAGGVDASLRPETATVTYLPFKRYLEFFRKQLPFGVFQMGKAFRNEISPRQNVLRGREFTQAEAQIFIAPAEKNNWEKYTPIKNVELPLWDATAQKSKKKPTMTTVEEAVKKKQFTTKAYAWCVWLAYHQFRNMGIPASRIRIRQHHDDEKAFYAKDAWDIEIHLNSFGWTEVCGIHDRGDYDLQQHTKFSQEKLTLTDNGKTITPHVLEIAFGVDRPLYALLDLFYGKVDKDQGKTTFNVPYHLAPVDVAIFPLMKKDGLPEYAQQVKEQLEQHFVITYDQAGSIGKRYLRAAEAGTPYCITIDHDSLTNNDVTIRDRNTEKQERISVKELVATLQQKLLHDCSE